MTYLKEELYNLITKDANVFNFIQEQALDGLMYRDYESEGNEWQNPAFWKTLGYDDKNVTQKSHEILHNEDIELIQKIDLSENTAESITRTLRFKHKKGNTVFMLCNLLPIKNENGKVIRILNGLIKISESEQLNIKDQKIKTQLKKLKRQEEFLEKINSAALIGYWDFNLEKQKIYWSNMTKEIHEVPLDYKPNLETAIHFYKEGVSRDKISAAIETAISTGQPFDLELQIITLKDNIRWVRVIGQVVFKNGIYKRLYGTFQNITLAKENHTALIQEKEKLQSVIQATNSGTWQWNIQTGETQHNELWANIIGYTLEEIQPIDTQKWISLVHPDDLKSSDENMKACFEKRAEYYQSEYRIKHKNGNWIWVLDKGKIISWTDDGKPLMMFGIHTDISEQKKALVRNMLFIEQMPTATAMFDTEMNYIAVSEKWRIDYQLTDQKILGKSHYDIFPEISEKWKQIYQKCLTGVSDKRDEDKLIKKDGEIQWLKWEIKPWYKDKTTIGGIIVHTTDITERKKTEEQLRISEETFRGNFENAAIGMALLNEHGKWLKVNQRLCKKLGYTEEEMLKLTFQDITHPDDIEADLNLLEELVTGVRNFYHMEKRYICKNGQTINIILAVSLIRDENNNPLHFISQIIDITPQKMAEKKLAEALNKIQGLIDASTHVSIIETDLTGTITTFNKGAENLLGYTFEEILNLKSLTVIHVKDEILKREEQIFNEFGQSIKGFDVFTYEANKGNYETREWTYVKKNGTLFPIQLTVTAIKTNGKISGYLGIAVDISNLKNAEKEIQSLLLVTKDQNERLKNFAHIVSHNLRSHSGNIGMMLDILLYENPDLSNNEFIELLNVASNNLKETIEHLNEVVLINTSIGDNLMNLNLNQFMESTLKSLIAFSKSANVSIHNNINPDTVIQGIPAYIESILLNFITNGIKYKSEERDSFIKIHCTKEKNHTVLHIEDNGIGIDLKKNRQKLFGMYKTFHTNTDARGIGLFITKNQVEALSGKIEVESELNKGTIFKIYFRNEKN